MFLLKVDMIQLLSPLLLLIIAAQQASALQCYRCTSSQPGCGKELNIRVQRWHSCPDTGKYGGENFCVKIIEKINSDIVITRECLMTIRHSEKHREKIPTVQRHNYCQPGRNNDPLDPYDEDMTFFVQRLERLQCSREDKATGRDNDHCVSSCCSTVQCVVNAGAFIATKCHNWLICCALCSD